MALKERSVIPPDIAEIICTSEIFVNSTNLGKKVHNKLNYIQAQNMHFFYFKIPPHSKFEVYRIYHIVK